MRQGEACRAAGDASDASDGASAAVGGRPHWAAAAEAPGQVPVARPQPIARAAAGPVVRSQGAAFAASALAVAGLGFLAVAGDPPAHAAALGIPPPALIGLIAVAALGVAAALALLAPLPADRQRPGAQRWLAFGLALALAIPLSGLAALFVDARAQVDGPYCAGCVAAGLAGLFGGLAVGWGAFGGARRADQDMSGE